LVRIDMSEYMEKHTVSRLVGAPPGYVGYDQGGQLTEIIRRKPYSVVLFDEIEKAHPEVLDILLQLLDDGRLTDGQGRVVNFKNTLIIMTSNLRDAAELKIRMRPEFINRIDEVITFNKLELADIKKIVDIQEEVIKKRLSERGVSWDLSEKVKECLSTIGFDPVYGGRPLKRVVQKYIQDPLSLELLSGNIKGGDTVKIFMSDEASAAKKAKVINKIKCAVDKEIVFAKIES